MILTLTFAPFFFYLFNSPLFIISYEDLKDPYQLSLSPSQKRKGKKMFERGRLKKGDEHLIVCIYLHVSLKTNKFSNSTIKKKDLLY